MQYKIIDIKDTANGFEVDVEFVINNKKQNMRFAFTHDAWRDESWRKTIEYNLLNIQKSVNLTKQKQSYINQVFTATEECTKEERPPAAIKKQES